MGDVFARTVLGLTAPSIGLLNVGSEELKGDDTLRLAAETLRASHIAPQFVGFVEGHDIAAGTTDVVVTDGFTGNVALKTGEGALKLIGDLLRQVFRSSLTAKIAYLLLRPGARPAARVARSAPLQRRGDAGAERRGGEVAWRHRRRGLRPCGGRGDGHGGAPVQRPHPRGPGPNRRIDGAGREEQRVGEGRRRPARASPPRHRKTMAIRSILAGVGAYLPERVVSNDELARTVDTSDEWIRERTGIRQRHIAGTARDRGVHGHRGGARRAGGCRRRAGRGRRDHPGHQHAGSGVSRHRAARAGGARRDRRVRLRPRRRLRRVHLRAVGGRRHDPHRPGARRAGDRQRGLFAHPELAGPRHLRAVRRRRRRGVPARRRGQRQRSTAAFSPPTCMPRARWATSCTSMARSDGATSPAIW